MPIFKSHVESTEKRHPGSLANCSPRPATTLTVSRLTVDVVCGVTSDAGAWIPGEPIVRGRFAVLLTGRGPASTDLRWAAATL